MGLIHSLRDLLLFRQRRLPNRHSKLKVKADGKGKVIIVSPEDAKEVADAKMHL